MSESEKPKVAEVLGPESTELAPDVREDIELRRADAEATIRVVEAIGVQLRTFAESPGVQEILKGFGRHLEHQSQLQLTAQNQAHERQMQVDRLAAERERRQDLQKNILLVLSGCVAVGGVWLVAGGHADPKIALAALAVLSALGLGRAVRPS